METIIGFLYNSMRAGTPLLFGTTGEIITEKSGSLNLGVEGMMAMGAICGYWVACRTNSLLLGILAAFLSAAAGALLYAFLTITLQANQNVTGLALTTFGVGVYQFIGTSLVASGTYPNFNDSPRVQAAVADKGIPLLRDIPYVGRLLFSYNIFVYVAVVVAVIGWLYILKTRPGLRMRAVGENPGAADAAGVNVTLSKYLHVVIGGGITGLGGLYLAMVTNGGAWNDFWISGMGWISVALVIFANWNPARAIFGAFFFGLLNTLLAWKGNLSSASPTLFGWVSKIPNEFYQMLPFFITAMVLLITSMRKKRSNAGPAALGLNYYREER